WATALKTVFRYASTSARRRAGSQSTGSAVRPRKQFNQRCAVRITYTKNKVAGQWRAHGRYIARAIAAQVSTTARQRLSQRKPWIAGRSRAMQGCGNLLSRQSLEIESISSN